MEYLTTRFEEREVVLRDLELADIPALLAYWHDTDPAYLAAAGVDLTKITTREETRKRYASIVGPPADPDRRMIIVAADGRPVAYSNLNLRPSREGFAHAHVLDPELRHRGLASTLFPSFVQIYFDHFAIDTLLFQTTPENEAINRLLQRFGLTPRRVHMPQPDGLSRPGDFNLYAISRDQVAQVAAAAAARR